MWSAVKTPGQRTYYANSETNETRWEKPEELYDETDRALSTTPWRQYETDEGQVYWYNESTEKSTWELPIKAPEIPLQVKIKDLFARNSDCTYAEILTQLVDFDEYWQMKPAERLEMVEKLREESKKISKEEAAQQRTAGIATIRAKATGYISAVNALEIAKGDKSMVLEALNDSTKFNIPYDSSINSSLNSQIAELLTGAASWDTVEAKARSKLGYTPNPQIIEVYRKAANDLHTVKMEQLKSREPVVKRQAARARIDFLNSLKSIKINQETEWADIVPQIETQIIRLSAFPGSTPLDLFFWYKENYAPLKNADNNKKKALSALKSANKRPDQVTFEEFRSITRINDQGVYRESREESYTNSRNRSRSRAVIDHDRGGSDSGNASLEY